MGLPPGAKIGVSSLRPPGSIGRGRKPGHRLVLEKSGSLFPSATTELQAPSGGHRGIL